MRLDGGSFPTYGVIPAKAGIFVLGREIPAFAGMTL